MGRTRTMLIEKRGFEPLALFRRIDGGEEILAWRQASHLIFPILIGTCRHDLSSLWTPQRWVGRERQHGVFGDWHVAIVSECAVHLRELVGEDKADSRQLL